MRLSTMLAFLGSLSAGLVGCGSSGGSDLSYQDYCSQVAGAMCDRYNTCGGAGGLAAFGYNSVADCTTQLQASFPSTPCLESGLYQGAHHPDKAQSCVNGFKNLACTSGLPAVCAEVCTYQ